MPHLDLPHFLGVLVAILAAAKLFGGIAQWIGQPAVLGELIAGVVLGGSALNIVDPTLETFHLLGELGVIILLFAIGLETDLPKLLQVGGASLAVALIGVVLPFALGYLVCYALSLPKLVGVVSGATLTATSVGITARVLHDLQQLHTRESQVILGAAVIDDVIGLVILAAVAGVAKGERLTASGVAWIAASAIAFLVGTLLVGRLLLPPLMKRLEKLDLPGTPTVISLCLAFGLAWLANLAGSATIIGAFAAGLLVRTAPKAHEIERGITQLGQFFVPLFFVMVGAAVDLSVFNPLQIENQRTLAIAALLIAAAILGKFLAGYSPFWMKVDKRIIGAGMIPRGEVGLIFAQMGLSSGVFDRAMFSAVTLMVMVTTFIAPPLLVALCPKPSRTPDDAERDAIEELVTEA